MQEITSDTPKVMPAIPSLRLIDILEIIYKPFVRLFSFPFFSCMLKIYKLCEVLKIMY